MNTYPHNDLLKMMNVTALDLRVELLKSGINPDDEILRLRSMVQLLLDKAMLERLLLQVVGHSR